MGLLFTWLGAVSLHFGDLAHRKNGALRVSSVDKSLPQSSQGTQLFKLNVSFAHGYMTVYEHQYLKTSSHKYEPRKQECN